jgi:NADH-quinone oxidoreductase subunit N
MRLLDLSYIYPEIWFVFMISFILIMNLYTAARSKWITYALCQITLVGALLFIGKPIGKKAIMLFYNTFIMDDVGNLLKFLICLIGFFVFFYARKYIFERQPYRSEYFILCLFSIFGMMVLVSAQSFLGLYLGIELLVLPLYALITIVKEDFVAPEAAMKYFVMGALASGMLLYGVSLLYGVTGSFEMQSIAKMLAFQSTKPHPALLFGLVFILVGLAFKFGAVPFHLWLPDVYEGSPMAVVLFIGTLPKLAAFGLSIRLLVDTFAAFNEHWQPLIMIMAILSLGLGNIVAIVQKNLKRMLAFSAIAHVGFLLLGLLAGPTVGFAPALNYMLIYVLMSLGVFAIMTALSYQAFEAENIQDFRGLSAHNPWMAFLMMMLLLSLAGIPPFAGFYAKLFVLDALMSAGYVKLAVYAVLLTVVGAFYYLRIIRVMFFESLVEPNHYRAISRPDVVVLSLSGLAILALGIFPVPLLNLCTTVLLTPK